MPNNFTPLDVHKFLDLHFPYVKRTVNAVFMLIGIISAGILIAIFYTLLQKALH